MGNLWNSYWKSVDACFIESAQVTYGPDVSILHFKNKRSCPKMGAIKEQSK